MSVSVGREGSAIDNIIVKPVYLRAVNAIVQPEVQIPCSAYFFRNWLPRLGSLRWCLVLTLRSVCTQRQPDGTNRGEICRADLAALIGIHEATISRILNSSPSTINPGWRVLQPLKDDDVETVHLSRFIPRLRYKYERDVEAGVTRRVGYVIDVVMDDPLIPEDEERLAVTLAEQLLQATGSPTKELTDISTWAEHDVPGPTPPSTRPRKTRLLPSTAPSGKTQTPISRSSVKAQFSTDTEDLETRFAASGPRVKRPKLPGDAVSAQNAPVSTLTLNFNYKGFDIPVNLRRKRDIRAAVKPLVEYAAASLNDQHSVGMFYAIVTQLYPHNLGLFTEALEKAEKEGKRRKSVNMGAAFVRAIRDSTARAGVALALGVKEESAQVQEADVEVEVAPSRKPAAARQAEKGRQSAYVLGSRVNKKQLWTSLLEELRSKTSRPTYEMWLRNCSIARVEDDTVVIATPSAFAREWVNERLLSIIRRALKQVVGRDMNVKCEAAVPGGGPRKGE